MRQFVKAFSFSLIALLVLAGCSKNLKKIPVTPAAMLNTFPPSFVTEGPVARSRSNYRLVSVGEQVNLDGGSSSAHDDASSLRYRWSMIAAPNDSRSRLSATDQPQATLLIDQAGTYHLQLEVFDNQSRSDKVKLVLSTESSQLPRSSFIALGDYGKGSTGQKQVSKAIEKLCDEQGCDFVLGLGDNIYPAGVSDVEDKQFKEKFEQPYANLPLPFYQVLGNHDTTGVSAGDGGFNPRGDIQIAYARSADKPSFRWQMPARYYRLPAPVEETELSPLVDLYAIDTTLLMSPYDDLSKYELPDIHERQQDWLSNEKRQSKAQWQLAFAHHPYLSNARHGNAGGYDHLYLLGEGGFQDRINGKLVKSFYEENLCHDMDLVLAGHDHALQYLKPVERCGNTEFIVSGAGASYQGGLDNDRNESYWQTGDALGFFHVEILAQTMTVTAYTVNEEEGGAIERYRRSISK